MMHILGVYGMCKSHYLNMHIQPTSGSRYLNIELSFYLRSYFGCGNSEGSSRTVR